MKYNRKIADKSGAGSLTKKSETILTFKGLGSNSSHYQASCK